VSYDLSLIDKLIDLCLLSTLAVYKLYRGVRKFHMIYHDTSRDIICKVSV